MNKKNKKIFIATGSVLAAASIAIPLVFIFSKGENKKIDKNLIVNKVTGEAGTTKKEDSVVKMHYDNDELRSKIYGIINKFSLRDLSFTKDIFSKEENVDVFTKLLSATLKDGMSKIKHEDIKIVLGILNLPPDLKNLFNQLAFTNGKFNLELLDLFFNKGISKMKEDKFKKERMIILNFLKKLLPTKIQKVVSTQDIEKMIFTGISEEEFVELSLKLVNQFVSIPFIGSIISSSFYGDAKYIYNLMPVLKKGFLNASSEDIRKTLLNFKKLVNFKTSFSYYTIDPFAHFIKDKKGVPKERQMLNVLKDISSQINKLATKNSKSNTSGIDEISLALFNLFNKGFNSINDKQGKQISNLVEWLMSYKKGNIYKRDLDSFKKVIKDFFKGLKDINNKPLDFNDINNSSSLEEVLEHAKKIKSYILASSLKGIYKSLSDDVKIKEIHIYNPKSWDVLLEEFSRKILSRYFDKNKKPLGEKHPIIDKVIEEFKKDDNKNTSNAYIWWDKIIDAASSVKTYDEDGKLVKIVWGDAFNDILRKVSFWHNKPYSVYKKFIDSIKKIIIDKKYYKKNSPKEYKMFRNKDFDKLFDKEIKSFKIKPILDKMEHLISEGLYYGKNSMMEIIVSKDKMNQYLYDNIDKYNFHKRSLLTIYKYREDVLKALTSYKIKKDSKIVPVNKDIIDFNKQEGVKEVYNAAKKFLEDNKNNFYSLKGQKIDLSKAENITKIIPKIPLKDYGYDITKEVLEKDPSNNKSKEATILNILFQNKKSISDFILKGYPLDKKGEEGFDNMIKDVIVMISSKIPFLRSFKDNPEMVLEILKKGILKDISDIIKRYRNNKTI